jgi:hypothetical protein
MNRIYRLVFSALVGDVVAAGENARRRAPRYGGGAAILDSGSVTRCFALFGMLLMALLDLRAADAARVAGGGGARHDRHRRREAGALQGRSRPGPRSPAPAARSSCGASPRTATRRRAPSSRTRSLSTAAARLPPRRLVGRGLDRRRALARHLEGLLRLRAAPRSHRGQRDRRRLDHHRRRRADLHRDARRGLVPHRRHQGRHGGAAHRRRVQRRQPEQEPGGAVAHRHGAHGDAAERRRRWSPRARSPRHRGRSPARSTTCRRPATLDKMFAVEHWFSDLAQSELFDSAKVDELAVTIRRTAWPRSTSSCSAAT